MEIYYNPSKESFSTFKREGTKVQMLYTAPDETARRTHYFSLSDKDFEIKIQSKFSSNRRNKPYIDIWITHHGIPLYPLSACLDDAINGKAPIPYSSYYQKFGLKDVTLDDWESACEIITNVYAKKDIWFLNEVPDAIDKFNSLLNNIGVQTQHKLVACKVFMELIEDCKLNKYQGISQTLSLNCLTIQQLAIEAINQNIDFETGVSVMELLYNLLKEANLLKDFYHHLNHCHE